MSKSGGGDVKRFPWSSYSARISKFLKEVGEKAKSGNLSLGVS